MVEEVPSMVVEEEGGFSLIVEWIVLEEEEEGFSSMVEWDFFRVGLVLEGRTKVEVGVVWNVEL